MEGTGAERESRPEALSGRRVGMRPVACPRWSSSHRVNSKGPPLIVSDRSSVFRASQWPLVPAILWMIAFFFIPLLSVFVISFAARGTYGGVQWTFSLSNYTEIFHPLYL